VSSHPEQHDHRQQTPATSGGPPAQLSDSDIEQQIADEMTDRELARRDIADRSLMDAAAAMRYSWPTPGLYDLHASLDSGHLNAARQVIADTAASAQPEPEAC
jgi:hypothetical protein